MLSSRFDEALAFACDLHRAQVRKGGSVPYISHLLAVAALVMEDGGSEEEVIAALLHDSIEDQSASYPGGRDGLRQEIERKFGSAVLEIVNACTDDDHHGKPEWRARKQAYLDHIPHASPRARRVSCADKLHNARTVLADYRKIGNALWQRFRTRNGGDQIWYFTELARAFKETGTGPMAEELGRVLTELRRECGI